MKCRVFILVTGENYSGEMVSFEKNKNQPIDEDEFVHKTELHDSIIYIGPRTALECNSVIDLVAQYYDNLTTFVADQLNNLIDAMEKILNRKPSWYELLAMLIAMFTLTKDHVLRAAAKGGEKEIQKTAKQLKRICACFASLVAAHTNVSVAKLLSEKAESQ